MTFTPDFHTAAFSSETGKWDTPDTLIAELASVFAWDLDVCADRDNVCKTFYSEKEDGLSSPWFGLCWMNPPYGSEIGAWINKAMLFGHSEPDGIRHIESVICLLPARTDTDWFQRNAKYASQIVFIKGRLKFGSRDHWIRHYQANLLKHSKSKLEGTQKKVFALLDKIGGTLCQDEVHDAVFKFFFRNFDQNNAEYNLYKWRSQTHLKPDAAPFPSCFMVFGQLNEIQRAKLNTYGWSVKP